MRNRKLIGLGRRPQFVQQRDEIVDDERKTPKEQIPEDDWHMIQNPPEDPNDPMILKDEPHPRDPHWLYRRRRTRRA